MAVAVVPSLGRTTRTSRSVFTTPVVCTEGTRIVVTLRGDLDCSARPVLADALSRLIALQAEDVVVDLTDTEFVDLAIVRVLGRCHQLLARQGRKLTFRSPSRLAARLLDLIGLTHLIEPRRGDEPCLSPTR
jgi:anti-anti-sigma factor